MSETELSNVIYNDQRYNGRHHGRNFPDYLYDENHHKNEKRNGCYQLTFIPVQIFQPTMMPSIFIEHKLYPTI